ncbi:MAG: alkaline phosphatase family protein [Deltaproteobacteria bacterium]|nr:alkaline phosphatase family protein [Deltaproteobacteria bacterium]
MKNSVLTRSTAMGLLTLAFALSATSAWSQSRHHRRRHRESADDARRDSDRMRRHRRYDRTREPTTRRGRPITLPLVTAPEPFDPPPVQDSQPRPYDHVVIVSIDGLRPDAIAMTDTPNLRMLRSQGAWAQEARTITHSYTLPSHTSMLSGVDVDRHGLLHNNFTPRHGFTRSVTALYIARDAGFTTAMFVSKPKFRHIAIPGSVDVFERPDYACGPVVRQAAAHLQATREGITFVHLSEPDGAGHSRGWMTESYMRAIAQADRCLGVLLRTIQARADRGRVLLLVSADHGGHGRTHGSTQENDMRIPWIAWGSRVRLGDFSEPVSTMDTAATALGALGLATPADWTGRPVRRALDGANGAAETGVASPTRPTIAR